MNIRNLLSAALAAVVFAVAANAYAGGACEPGTYSGDGNEPCTPCNPGFYQPNAGSLGCSPCPDNTFAPNAGSASCTECPGGAMNSCSGNGICDDGAGSGSCACFAGYTGVACENGTCAAGSYSATGFEPCTPCSTGYYSESPGSTSCTACNAGTANGTSGASSASACVPCNAGFYATSNGSAACFPCDGGYYSGAQAATCSPCDAGSYSSSGAASCTPCAAGQYSDSPAMQSCQYCAEGTYQPNLGSTSCMECPGGSANQCNGNGTCDDGSGSGSCACDAGYSGVACEIETSPCPATPQAGCVDAGKAGFQIKNTGDAEKNQLKWKWGNAPFAYEAIGDPSSATDYWLCIYDTTGGVASFAGDLHVAADAAWVSKPDVSWMYKDPAGTQDGVTNLALKTSAAGNSKAQLKAKGALLPLPTAIGGGEYFDQDTTVVVQLLKVGGPGSALCLESTFDVDATKKNDETQFKAVAP